MFSTRLFVSAALVAVLFVCQCKGVPVAKPEDGALITVGAETTALIPTSSNSTEIDTLSEVDATGVRVKRSGCGCCGCGGCCCRPCCCGCGCCGCGGCGCCGCGGGRKRRSLQNLRIAHMNQIEGITKVDQPALPSAADFVDSEESSPIEATEQLKSQTTNPIIAKLAAFSPAHLLTNLHDQFKQAVRQLVL
ncbi:unnamed protein product, partial [Mesorhabditis spiculigera]